MDINVFLVQPHPNNLNCDVDDESDWILIGDDSSSNGRKGKAELIKGFSDISGPGVTSSVSQPIPLQNEICNIYSTSSSDGDFAGHFSDLYFANIPRSVPSDFSISSGSGRDGDPPKHFLCPISCEIMKKPVIAAGK